MSTPARVLVIRFGSIGDIVVTSGAVDALAQKWPEAEIFFATKAKYAALLRHNPKIHRVLELTAQQSFSSYCREVRAHGPDAVVDLHGNTRSRILTAAVTTARRRVRWSKRDWWQGVAVRLRLSTYRSRMQIAARYHDAIERLVRCQLPRGSLRLHVSESATVAVRKRLLDAGVDVDRPVLGIAPGARWFTKRWPVDRYCELARRASNAGIQVVITGDNDDADLGVAVRHAVPQAVDFTGALELDELVALLATCSAFVANDSGPMHIARALGTPTVALFGSTDPAQFDFTGHAVAFAGLECSPCSLYGVQACPLGHLKCLRDIDSAEVWESVQPLLASGRVAAVSG